MNCERAPRVGDSKRRGLALALAVKGKESALCDSEIEARVCAVNARFKIAREPDVIHHFDLCVQGLRRAQGERVFERVREQGFAAERAFGGPRYGHVARE